MVRPSRAILLVLLGLCAGCAREAACPGGTQPAVVAQLLFGRSMKGGGAVGDESWRAFLAREMTLRFPDGLTVLDGYGQWRNPATGRIGSEASTVVEIVAADAPDLPARLDAVREAYKRAFSQDSVGLVTMPGCASF